MSEKPKDVDVVILGVGTCGEDLSLRLLDAGLEVVGIEARLVGGECPYWACIPSKVMVQAANSIREARRAGPMTGADDVIPNWAPVADRLRWITGGWNDAIAVERYRERGGTMIKGRGRLSGPRTVEVGDRSFRARIGIVIATGSKPFIPPIEGIADVGYWTTHDVMKMDTPPESMVILGGGAAGCELGQVMARFGVKVKLVESGDHLLAREEPEASEAVEAAFNDEGIEIHTGAKAVRVEPHGREIAAMLRGGKKVTGERLLVTTGRTVDLSGLGLESAGLDGTAGQIKVDDRMRAADGIWAMGDVTGKPYLTHVAEYQSAVIASEILGEDHPPARYDAVPRGIFTDPEVGSVGKTEAEASAAGLDTIVILKRLPATFRGLIDGVENGIIKIVVDRKTGLMAGGTVVGRRGTDMLGFLNLALHAHIPLAELQTMIYAFPSYYGAIGEALGVRRGLTTVIDPDYQGLKAIGRIHSV